VLADGSHSIVALSRTSGGTVCALLAWYGVLTGGGRASRLLERFFEANAATTLRGKAANAWLAGLARLEVERRVPQV
jgi:NTE family protein